MNSSLLCSLEAWHRLALICRGCPDSLWCIITSGCTSSSTVTVDFSPSAVVFLLELSSQLVGLKLVLLADTRLARMQVKHELHGPAKQIRASHLFGSSVNQSLQKCYVMITVGCPAWRSHVPVVIVLQGTDTDKLLYTCSVSTSASNNESIHAHAIRVASSCAAPSLPQSTFHCCFTATALIEVLYLT